MEQHQYSRLDLICELFVYVIIFAAIIVSLLITPSCAHRDCRHVAVDSYIRAVEQGQTARIVVGKVWEGAHVPADQRYHAECQVRVNGEWRYLDNGTGEAITCAALEPPMEIGTVWTLRGFVKTVMDDRR